ncbi:hypothetical protein Lal_00038122 [Lupinus albus]|uniref:Uncharacterized protein n=1 Tax=Lupinus albus TaxID=3870 RepID=A0A6A5N1Z9_LUPAL|nr:hypothetical protein Lalb_Chr02g0156841 [Lupinus albus]KAF1877813.1 hypothetical protein Lal_00038122 [Lupinus albus]
MPLFVPLCGGNSTTKKTCRAWVSEWDNVQFGFVGQPVIEPSANKIWVHIIEAKYFTGSDLLLGGSSDESSFWKSIMKTSAMLRDEFSFRFGFCAAGTLLLEPRHD